MRVLGKYAIVYLAAGSGEYGDARGVRRRVGPGALIWIFPDLPHFYGPGPGERWDEAYLVFEGPLFDLWRPSILSPAAPVWQMEPVGFWFSRIEEVARAGGSGRGRAFGQISRLQALVAEMAAARGAEGEAAWVGKACRSLDAPECDLPGLAASLGMSYEAFRKKFARQTGTPPAAYQAARKIDRACSLLMDRSASNREIAERLGFCDEFHFSKAFTRRMGLSPRAFRIKALGKAGERG